MHLSVRTIPAFLASLDPAQRASFQEIEGRRAAALAEVAEDLETMLRCLPTPMGDATPSRDRRVLQLGTRIIRSMCEEMRTALAEADPPETPLAREFTADLDEVYAWASDVCAATSQPSYNDPALIAAQKLRGEARAVALRCFRHPDDPRSATILKALAILTIPEKPGNNGLAQQMFQGRWGWLKRELAGL